MARPTDPEEDVEVSRVIPVMHPKLPEASRGVAEPEEPSRSLRQTGYAGALYPRSLQEFGDPLELPSSGGWLLKRRVPGEALFDATACYPYLVCRSWAGLAADLRRLEGELVSFCGVADPFGDFRENQLAEAFDRVIHFKDHYIADLSRPIEELVSQRNLRAAERALRTLDVEFYESPLEVFDLWMDLYPHHVRRFSLTGLKAFSRESLRRQFEIPGAVVSVARSNGTPVAAHMQMIHDGVCHGHLACGLPEANKLGASYALYLSELLHYRRRARVMDWGADPGLARQGSLSSFKLGWSNARRATYFCTRILDRAAYERLSDGRSTEYFPAYREGELA